MVASSSCHKALGRAEMETAEEEAEEEEDDDERFKEEHQPQSVHRAEENEISVVWLRFRR